MVFRQSRSTMIHAKHDDHGHGEHDPFDFWLDPLNCQGHGPRNKEPAVID